MKRTIATIIAAVAAAGFATSTIAQTRHDERPHGYDAKVAVQQSANAAKASTFATGPRPHDAVRRVTKAAPATEPTKTAKTEQK